MKYAHNLVKIFARLVIASDIDVLREVRPNPECPLYFLPPHSVRFARFDACAVIIPRIAEVLGKARLAPPPFELSAHHRDDVGIQQMAVVMLELREV